MKQKMLVRNGEAENSFRAAKRKVFAFLPEVNSESTNFLLLLFLTKEHAYGRKQKENEAGDMENTAGRAENEAGETKNATGSADTGGVRNQKDKKRKNL